MADLGFVHVYEAAADPQAPTLLLLHGTGGTEEDLVPVAELLDARAGVLSPRGKVLEHGLPRFFRRLAEGVFDEADLRLRARELAAFVRAASAEYAFDPHRVVAVGFSNGANIAASLLLVEPDVLAGAILFRAMVPLVPDDLPHLNGAPVLILGGRVDPIVPREETERLAALLGRAGADVSLEWQPGGHQLTQADIFRAREWLARADLNVRSTTIWRP